MVIGIYDGRGNTMEPNSMEWLVKMICVTCSEEKDCVHCVGVEDWILWSSSDGIEERKEERKRATLLLVG